MPDNLKFIDDITIPDNSLIKPGEPFLKTWRVKNSGDQAWGDGYQLVFATGNSFGAPLSVPLPPAQPDETVDVSVPMIAPSKPGTHRSLWRAKNAAGQPFGMGVFALINVVENVNVTFNGVIDLSHHNTITDLAATKADGIVGIIFKATQGVKFVDPKYQQVRKQALELGFLWGAYHFGTAADPVAQADHFLTIAQPDEKTLITLDFEANPLDAANSMSLDQADMFIQHIRTKTGRFPVFYTGAWYINPFLKVTTTSLAAQCPLWIAAYASKPPVPRLWETWTLWQYTDGTVGNEPRKTAGIVKADRNLFNGSEADLRAWWGT
jgi:lysozyme